MTIVVRGIGWLTEAGYGCIRSGQQQDFAAGEDASVLPKRGIFSHPFKNFGRLDGQSRMTAYAVALALQDAGIEYAPGTKQDIGIVGTNATGSLCSDLDYFRDYVDGGRKLSRGNLFIYTLPSSPLGEASIHFGLLGPVLYAAGSEPGLLPVLDIAADMILSRETPMVLAGRAEEREAVYLVLGSVGTSAPSAAFGLDEIRKIAGSTPDTAGMVRKLSSVAAGKG